MIKFYPEDQYRDNGTIGIKFPTNGNSTNNFFNTSRLTEEQAITNYINLLLTMKGERYMHPNYGIGIQTYLFEQNTGGTRSQMEFEIRTQAAFWLPYIVNHRIEIRERADIPGLNVDSENAIHILITFSVTESGANKQIVIFQRGGIVTAQTV
jgi:phage baseplate assembly protein W